MKKQRTLAGNWRPRALEAVDAFAYLFESKPLGQGNALFHKVTEQIASKFTVNARLIWAVQISM
jgi:hypothetical protein